MSFLKRHWLITVVLGLLFLWVLMLVTPRLRGHAAASRDLSRGHYEVKTIGFVGLWREDYAAILRDRYGVQLSVGAGCLASRSRVSYCKAYNAVQRPTIIAHFGRDIFRESRDEARAAWIQKAGQRWPQPKSNQ